MIDRKTGSAKSIDPTWLQSLTQSVACDDPRSAVDLLIEQPLTAITLFQLHLIGIWIVLVISLWTWV